MSAIQLCRHAELVAQDDLVKVILVESNTPAADRNSFDEIPQTHIIVFNYFCDSTKLISSRKMSKSGMTVYIVTNLNKTVLYTGVTNNLSRRLWEHEQNISTGSKTFTGRYRAHYLLYFEHFENPKEGIEREKEIKGWVRKKKELLITQSNPEWKFLNDLIEPPGW